jgi:two-component system, NtrC family, sensor histidine kinase HydH
MNGRTVADEKAGSVVEITSIVHDPRNPLSAIHGCAEILISSRLSDLQVHRIARNLYGASIRMRELLDEFFSRNGGAGNRVEPSGVRELVASAVDKIDLVAEFQSVRILQNVPENLVICADRRRIQRIFVNLCVNALDVMPDGGTIRISAIPVRDSVLIKVSDTGPGIAPEILDRLFQPFATAGKANGLGLGLAVSRQAAIDHGGEMWVESSRRGACFAVRLPRTNLQSRAASC